MGVTLSSPIASPEVTERGVASESLDDGGSSWHTPSRGRRAATSNLQGPARRGPGWKSGARRLLMQDDGPGLGDTPEGRCASGESMRDPQSSNCSMQGVEEIVVSFEYHCQALWQEGNLMDPNGWREDGSNRSRCDLQQAPVEGHHSAFLCPPRTPGKADNRPRGFGSSIARRVVSRPYHTQAVARCTGDARTDLASHSQPQNAPHSPLDPIGMPNSKSADVAMANVPPDAHQLRPYSHCPGGVSSGSTFSFLSGAALCANTTLANSILCTHAAKNGFPPPIDSPRAFLEIGPLSASSPSLLSCSICTSCASASSTCPSCSSSMILSSSASSASSTLANSLDRASCSSSSAPDSFGPSFLSAHDVRAAGGAAGEDRVHAVCSEASGWVFCGVYDGFNGRDAADFLATSMWESIGMHLRQLQYPEDLSPQHQQVHHADDQQQQQHKPHLLQRRHTEEASASSLVRDPSSGPASDRDDIAAAFPPRTPPPTSPVPLCSSSPRPSVIVRSPSALSPSLPPLPPTSHSHATMHGSSSSWALGGHSEAQEAEFQRRVLARLQQALAHTEREFFRFVDAEMEDRPDLAMVGSCVLLLLIHGPYLFSVNLGDSRALLAMAKPQPSLPPTTLVSPAVSPQGVGAVQAGRGVLPLSLHPMAVEECEEKGEEEEGNGSEPSSPPVLRVGLGMHPKSIKSSSGDLTLLQHQGCLHSPTSESKHWRPQAVQQLQQARSPLPQRRPVRQLTAIQLSEVHCCDNEAERQRVISEHQEDAATAVSGDRVKGKLRVTRAFGAGYLKSTKLNDGLMGIFRVRELDSPPYISSTPFAHARRLGPMDRFAVAGSDGLFDFFSNEEVVDEVAAYLEDHPMGDPAKHMLELLLERAARQAGIPMEELRSIPSGRRRKYHDDVTIVVIILGPNHRTSQASTIA